MKFIKYKTHIYNISNILRIDSWDNGIRILFHYTEDICMVDFNERVKKPLFDFFQNELLFLDLDYWENVVYKDMDKEFKNYK